MPLGQVAQSDAPGGWPARRCGHPAVALAQAGPEGNRAHGGREVEVGAARHKHQHQHVGSASRGHAARRSSPQTSTANQDVQAARRSARRSASTLARLLVEVIAIRTPTVPHSCSNSTAPGRSAMPLSSMLGRPDARSATSRCQSVGPSGPNSTCGCMTPRWWAKRRPPHGPPRLPCRCVKVGQRCFKSRCTPGGEPSDRHRVGSAGYLGADAACGATMTVVEPESPGVPGVPGMPGVPGAPGVPGGPGTGTGTATVDDGGVLTTVGDRSHALSSNKTDKLEKRILVCMS